MHICSASSANSNSKSKVVRRGKGAVAYPEGEAVEAEVAAAAAGGRGDVRGLVARGGAAGAGVEHAQAALIAVNDGAVGERVREARVHRAAGRGLAGLGLRGSLGEALLHAGAVEVPAVQDQVAPAADTSE